MRFTTHPIEQTAVWSAAKAVCSRRETLRKTPLWQAARGAKRIALRAIFDAARAYILSRQRFRLLVVAGQKRSGNHVFLNWVLSQTRGPAIFYNHVSPETYPTERHRREFRPNGFAGLPFVVFSYEDREIEAIFEGGLAQFLEDHRGQWVDPTLAVIFRDPRNLLASRFRKWPEEHAAPERCERIISLYENNLETALCTAVPRGFAQVLVAFDALLSSAPYRQALAARLGIPNGMLGLDKVTDYGNGSSFDGTAASGRAFEMAVSERWRAFENDPVFRHLTGTERFARIEAQYRRIAGTG